MHTTDVPRSIRLPIDVDERLTQLAHFTGRSRSYYLRELVTTGIDDLERAYDIAARAEQIRTGQRETLTLDTVLADLDITSDELRDGSE